MIYTIMKTTFKKCPQVKVYRDYKRWSQSNFERELQDKLIFNHSIQYLEFEEIFLQALEANSPTETKILLDRDYFTSILS